VSRSSATLAHSRACSRRLSSPPISDAKHGSSEPWEACFLHELWVLVLEAWRPHAPGFCVCAFLAAHSSLCNLAPNSTEAVPISICFYMIDFFLLLACSFLLATLCSLSVHRILSACSPAPFSSSSSFPLASSLPPPSSCFLASTTLLRPLPA